MFKQLSQLSKNLTDELQKGLSDDFLNDNANPSNVDLNQTTFPDGTKFIDLPKEVQAKLRKFEKYESKYPALLNAYKNEKTKTIKFEVVQKILIENTPISDLNDVEETLPAFFSNISNRTVILNNEIKRLTKVEGEKAVLQEELTKLKSAAESTANKSVTNDSIEDILNLTATVEESPKEIELLKKTHDELTEKDQSITEALHEVEIIKEALVTKETEITKLENDIQKKDLELTKLESDITTKNETIKSLEESKNAQKDETAPETIRSEPTPVLPNINVGGNKKNKKKNKKKMQQQQAQPRIDETLKEENNSPSPGTQPNEISEKYDILLQDFEKLKEEHELCDKWEKECNKLKSSLETRDGVNENRVEELEKKCQDLNNEMTVTKESLKGKLGEIEEVRDMLREVGNDLVDARDTIKDLSLKASVDTNAQNKLESLEKDNKINIEKLKNFENKRTELQKNINTINLEKSALNEKFMKLQFENTNKSNQLKDYNVVKNSITQKDKTIIYLENQVKEYNENQGKYKLKLDSFITDNTQLNNRVELLKKENVTLNNDANKNNSLYENYLKENGKLSERLLILQEKYDTLDDLKSNSNDQVDTIKRQCEELNVKLRESNKKIRSLDDDLSDYTSIIQDKTKESETMRRLLTEFQNDNSNKDKDYEMKISVFMEEKANIQNQLTLQSSKQNIKLQNLSNLNNELTTEVNNLKLKEKKLTSDLENLEQANTNFQRKNHIESETSSDFDKIKKNLKDLLSKSDQKLHDLHVTNTELMGLNNDLNKKLDRLTKNYRSLSTQLNASKENANTSRMNRSSSVSSQVSNTNSFPTANLAVPEPSPRSSSSFKDISSLAENSQDNVGTSQSQNEKLAYVKNVLLGFLEHKEQRNQLLPVISILLQLDSNDEKRLLMALR